MVKIRIWSFHPSYLDSVGLSRAINEAISGYKALTGKQDMWRNHSQLIRFREQVEYASHKYNLMRYITVLIQQKTNIWHRQIDVNEYDIEEHTPKLMTVTEGQLKYEWQHYLNKLKTQKGRDKELYEQLKDIEMPRPHPMFEVVPGAIESWEIIKNVIENE